MRLFSFLRYYKKVEKHIVKGIAAQFFLQTINASFMAILLIHMEKMGFEDYESASFVSFRFLGVLLFAFPLGLFIKGRKIKPIFLFSATATPILALLILESIDLKNTLFLYASLFLWGASFMGMQISILPYILRNAKEDTHMEAITLSHTTWSIGGIFGGTLIYVLSAIDPVLFDEKLILQIISITGLCSALMVLSIKRKEAVPKISEPRYNLKDFDWVIILKALIPTLLIAIGAGLTIPFIGLFFFKVHHIDSNQFALLSGVATLIVFFSILLVPIIREKLGYKTAIPLTQSIAIFALVVLAVTEIIPYAFASVIAIVAFLMRQPLMNIAAPMTSDLVMKYVGVRNREMMSALSSSVWSGSWFISSIIFQLLRQVGLRYVYVFLITAALYGVGVIAYYFLILDYERKRQKEEWKEQETVTD